jgi:hypothetical protein
MIKWMHRELLPFLMIRREYPTDRSIKMADIQKKFMSNFLFYYQLDKNVILVGGHKSGLGSVLNKEAYLFSLAAFPSFGIIHPTEAVARQAE